MSQRSVELRQKRDENFQRMKALQKLADDQKRSMTETEVKEFDDLNDKISAMKTDIDAEELRERRVLELDAEMRERPGPRAPLTPDAEPRSANPLASTEYRDAFRAYLGGSKDRVLPPDVQRALSVGSSADGGILVPPATLGALEPILRNANVMRTLAKVITVRGDQIIPFQSTKATAYRTAEGKTANADTTLKFKGSQLGAHKYTSEALFSGELLQDVDQDVEGFVNNELGLAMGELEELDFITGDGVGKPRGVLTAATDSGVTFASATAITPDELFDVQHALPRYFRKNASWLVADLTVKAFRKFKATTNQYLGVWQAGLEAGAPDILLGKPIVISDNIPAMASSAKSVLFGDFSNYLIVDRAGRTFQRLVEKYAETDQIAILLKERMDGDLLRKDAVIFATQHS